MAQYQAAKEKTPGTAGDDDLSNGQVGSRPNEHAPHWAGRAVKQPRHFVLKKFEEWMNQEGLAFVAIDDVTKTTPTVAPYIAGLDFIVLRGEEKLLVTVRPNLSTKKRERRERGAKALRGAVPISQDLAERGRRRMEMG